MLSYLLGNIDGPAALTVLFICGMITVIVVALIVRTPARKVELDAEAARDQRMSNDELITLDKKLSHERELAKIALQREVEFKRIDSGMIELRTAEQRRAEQEG